MASSANTFGTFLETIKKLEDAAPAARQSFFPESEVLEIAKMLGRTGGQAPVRVAMSQAGIAEPVFFRAVFAGREKGIFDIDEQSEQAVLKLTKLGYGFVS